MTQAGAPFRIMIVDDEPVARQRVRRLVAREPGVEVVAECGTGREAVAGVLAHRPDLLVLDVQMPELDGFGVIAALPPDQVPLVIFVTAFDEHALRAFDVHAVDYVLKPIDPDRLRVALTRARSEHGRAAAAEQHARLRGLLNAWTPDAAAPPAQAPDRPREASAPLQRFLVKAHGKMFFVNTADVDWIEADGNYVRLHVGAASHMIRETIVAVERALPASTFARIHRSAIVNLDRIAEMRQWSSGDYIVVLTTGARLKLSRTYRESIEAAIR
ncbi:MAG: LytTR family DNA-binding domain-containing protein [Gemmatimonadaceae bacterium]